MKENTLKSFGRYDLALEAFNLKIIKIFLSDIMNAFNWTLMKLKIKKIEKELH